MPGSAIFFPFAFLLPSLAHAFTWQFVNSPRQCETVQFNATGGSPPYNLLMIPNGPTSLSNGNEVRTVQQIAFNDSSSLSFRLRYPANTSFVAVVSDSTGFGSGGTTLPVTVLNSADTSCYDASKSVTGDFVFSINPTGGLTQCQSTRFYWQQSLIQGNVTFKGVIPGGQSFEIPVTSTSTDSNGTGFSWIADVRAQTNIIIVAGDDRGPVGGSAPYTINAAQDSSCLNSESPSSTAGQAAGGAYPTNTDGSANGGGNVNNGSGNSDRSGSGTNVGAIVGGVVGGVGGLIVAIILAWFLLMRKRRRTASYNKERPVNILQDDDDDDRGRAGELPQYYAPEPFLAPEPTTAQSDRESLLSEAPGDRRPGTPAGMTDITTSSRKTAMPRLRPVNIVQHEDAGPSGPAGDGEEPETVELPPAYTHIRPSQPSTPAPGESPQPAAAAAPAAGSSMQA